MLTFPTNPQLDDEFQRWRWDGAKWVRIGAEPPAPPGLFTPTAPGVVPASGGGSANFLRADGTWSAPPPPPGLFTSTAPGIVPGSGDGTVNFLRADGSWVAPPAPSAQQGDVRYDSGKLERFDGTAWVEIALGGGPHMGVTDGSNAVPGEVGEWRTSTFSVVMNTNPFTGIAGTIVLPAGDWHTWVRVGADVGGFNPNPTVAPTGFVNPTMFSISGGNQAYARFMPGLTWDTGLNAYTQMSGSITLGPVRTTSAAPDTIYCQMAMHLTGIPAAGNFTGTCSGEFWARRVR